MDAVQPQNAQIAMDIVEHGPSVAVRVSGENGAWNTLFITENISAYGYTRAQFMSGKLGWADLIHPEDIEPLCQKLDDYAEKGIDRYTDHYRIFSRDGASHWVAATGTAARDAAGRVRYTDFVVTNRGEAMALQAKIRDNLRQQQVLNDVLRALHFGGLDEAFRLILEHSGQHLGISRAVLFEDNARHTACKAVYEWAAAGIPPLMADGDYLIEYRADIPEIEQALKEHGVHVADHGAIPRKSAAELERQGVTAAAAFAVYHSGGERYGFISFSECVRERRWENDILFFLRNISQLVTTALMRKQSEEAIRRMAYQDQLTGLNNRYSFDMHMERAIADAHRLNKSGYVLFIDMDDFKVINDAYGHDYGDALLVAVAEYMRESFDDSARLFRFGGDEFTILVDHRHAGRVREVIDALLARSRHPWSVKDREFYCTISVGVFSYPGACERVPAVIKNADIALYQAKSGGKNKHVMYKQGLENVSQRRVETEHRMRDAIDAGFSGFRVFYQPLVDIGGGIVGAEALVRWQDKNGNLIPPGDFVPLAEYLGLIVPLGEFVLREAAVHCKRVNRTFPRFYISVNISMRQFQQADFLQRAESVLRESGVELSNIVLEVTEGMVVQDLDHMEMMIEQLRGLGLRIAMDDFGTGYSSLNNMRRLPLDIVKIDRSFIRDVTTDAYSKSFIRMITDLGHSMGRDVCVEGVETAAQYGYCADCGVDIIQGFYFHKPMPAQDLETLLSGDVRAKSC